MTEEDRDKLIKLFHDNIQGGSTDTMESILDIAIDEGDLSEDFYRKYETEICAIFDANWFTCTGCGWTMPISEMSEENDDWICTDCD